MKSIKGAALIISLLLLTATSSFALPYTCITNNGNGCVAMSSQLSITISQNAAGLPVFTFVNAGPIASSIAALYWDDDNNLLSSINLLTGSGSGVSFSAGGAPPSLPSQNTASPAFVSDISLTATSNGSSANGINPGESLAETFNLESGTTYAIVLAAFDAGTLRSGIHVQSIGTVGGSDSLVNGLPVPEPVSLLLLGFGLLGLAGVSRFKK